MGGGVPASGQRRGSEQPGGGPADSGGRSPHGLFAAARRQIAVAVNPLGLRAKEPLLAVVTLLAVNRSISHGRAILRAAVDSSTMQSGGHRAGGGAAIPILPGAVGRRQRRRSRIGGVGRSGTSLANPTRPVDGEGSGSCPFAEATEERDMAQMRRCYFVKISIAKYGLKMKGFVSRCELLCAPRIVSNARLPSLFRPEITESLILAAAKLQKHSSRQF